MTSGKEGVPEIAEAREPTEDGTKGVNGSGCGARRVPRAKGKVISVQAAVDAAARTLQGEAHETIIVPSLVDVAEFSLSVSGLVEHTGKPGGPHRRTVSTRVGVDLGRKLRG